MNEVRFWRSVFSLLLIGVGLVFVFHVWSILIPFILGAGIAYVVHPLVDQFVALGLKRNRVVFVLYAILLTTAVCLGLLFIPSLISEFNVAIKEIPTYAANINGAILEANLELQEFLGRFFGEKAARITIPFQAEDILENLFYKLPGNLIGFAHVGLWILIIPFVSFFALSHGRKWIDAIYQWTPSQHVEGLLGLFAELNATLGGFIRGVVIEGFCVGFITMLGLLMFGLKGAVLLGVVTGLLNFVPFLAPIVGGGVALLAAYTQQFSPSALLGIFLLFVGVRLIDDFILIPFVVGQYVRLHPVIMLFAVLAGVEIGGFIGLVFALPVAFIIKVILTIVLRNQRDNIKISPQQVHS